MWDEEFLTEVHVSIFLSRSEDELSFPPETCYYGFVAREDIFRSLNAGIKKDIIIFPFCLDLESHASPKHFGKLMRLKKMIFIQGQSEAKKDDFFIQGQSEVLVALLKSSAA